MHEGGAKARVPTGDTMGTIWLWIVLGVITGVFLLIVHYCENNNWMEGKWGRLTGRSGKLGFFGGGNFLHGTIFEHNPIMN